MSCFDDARGKKTFCLSNNACINTIGRKYCPFSKDINNRNKCACLSSKRSKNCAEYLNSYIHTCNNERSSVLWKFEIT